MIVVTSDVAVIEIIIFVCFDPFRQTAAHGRAVLLHQLCEMADFIEVIWTVNEQSQSR